MKRCLGLIVAIMLVGVTFGATETVDGVEYTYSISNGEATIEDEYSAAIPTSTSGDLVIPSTLGGYPVTTIGREAFHNCSSLTSVTIPASVMTIRESAFAGCTGISTFYIPCRWVWEGFMNIGGVCVGGSGWSSPESGVFYGCTGLKSVTIAKGVSRLPNYMFAGCSALKEVRFLGDKPEIVGWDTRELLLGTPESLVVHVDSKTQGWFEPLNYGRLTRWQGRRVSYDNEPPFVRGDVLPEEVELARDELYGAANMLAAIGEVSAQMKGNYLMWAQGIVEEYPELINAYSDLVTAVGEIPVHTKDALLRWTSRVVTQSLTPPPEFDVIGGGDSTTSSVVAANLTVTNVVMHYVVNSIRPEFAMPITKETGLVSVMTEVTSMGVVSVPSEWAKNYPNFESRFGSDFGKALVKDTGKVDAAGQPMFVWQDYVSGTDPTNPNDKFTASMTIVDGKPVISWTPELDDERAAMRKYTIYGKAKLTDGEWSVVPAGSEVDYNFFKVTVEMK